MFFIYLSLDREMDTKYVCALIRVTVSTFMSNKLFHFIWTMPKVQVVYVVQITKRIKRATNKKNGRKTYQVDTILN